MKREMRRKDRMLTEAEVEKIMKENAYGILSIMCKDGYPYGVPINYAYDHGKFYFHHTAETSLLGENISKDTKACFTIVGNTELLPDQFSTKYESVVAFGTVQEASDKMEGIMKLVNQLSTDFTENGAKYAQSSLDKIKVYEFEIEHMTGKARK